jgi:uncharacterized protein YceH (UPF0502 family)
MIGAPSGVAPWPAMVDALDPHDLTTIGARVLGVLVEKQLTTPDAYPLTLNALTNGCNQTSNREPVVQYEPYQVETAALALKAQGLVRVVHPGSGERATKYRQVADEAFGLTPPERALVGVLLVRRSPQTVSELKTRSERLHPFGSTADVEATLDALAARTPPFVAVVEPRAGQKERRWLQLLEGDAEARAASSAAATVIGASTRGGSRVDELEERIAALEARVASLVEALGDLVELPDADSPRGVHLQ